MSWGAYNDRKYAELRSLQEQARASWKDGDKDHERECVNCDALPTVHPTELCGPCCFGEASTINGNW